MVNLVPPFYRGPLAHFSGWLIITLINKPTFLKQENSADSEISACKFALLSAQITFVAAQKTQVDSTLFIQTLCREAYSLIEE
jgi:hypothetical protein